MDFKAEKDKVKDLFGGSSAWDVEKWSASDDRVRGGKSQSYLEIDDNKAARFHGNLDIKTLGGAGFASQKSTVDLDLSDFVAVRLNIAKGDKKRYTFILKDKLLPKNEDNGREQATISYEADFTLPSEILPGDAHNRSVIIPFDSLNATYRGKLQKDAPKIDTKNIKQISLMNRSFFGTQEGDFSLTVSSITAISKMPKQSETVASKKDGRQLEEQAVESDKVGSQVTLI
ncbi:hypothetical protein LTR78_007806 [Recurvomyces mirabilis]|uniref:NADH:ubiquinone oxidoreductase intermediate-associated protein 30 domain-containing protein n=1 Tax=Recurvomyces mirabilis TaxID=574656 RepID=A0AAE0TUF6_9PEZI|nr:hypothetical protein LTR78_007806 [Recurvomyces mirabilis]KAK5160152.1 hypothetical protein LTS14_002259 [Recurvomyces mirabilis]